MRLIVVLGTRPEAIKLAPVIFAARRRKHQVTVVFSGQHRNMVGPLLDFFGITPDLTLDVMSPNQSLTGLSAKVLASLDEQAAKVRGNILLVQGDTTTAFTAAYWAFCHNIPVAHVEAGLRTHDLSAPFPEEANRQLIGRLASLHFPPTAGARDNLLREGVSCSRIHTVGNTAIDALEYSLAKIQSQRSTGPEGLDPELFRWIGGRRLVLITAHRRESFGVEFENICRGIRLLLDSDESLCAIYPVHPNPNVKNTVESLIGNHPRIRLVAPLPYAAFVTLMREASLLLTDSGGVQEEGPTLRKPILVMREVTERPEGIRRGFAKLVGTDPAKILRESKVALKQGCRGRGKNPYGDGKAGEKIVKALEKFVPRLADSRQNS
jgi:UDP-N-acetylglucosamine 2-epimerase